MNLPNYFLADLPPDAELSAVMLTEACQTLKRNRLTYLAGRSTRNLVALLSHLGAEWLDQDYVFRKLALERGPEALGFSRETIAAGLDSFFKELTVGNLERLIEQDLGHRDRLEQLVSTQPELLAGRAAFARSPEFLVHISAGNIPSPALHSMVLGLLLGAAQFIKCARGASLLPRLFAHSIYHVEPKLGACLELAEWPGGRIDLEDTVFRSADCITATGGDQALEQIRTRVPVTTRFIGYGHRVSFAFVSTGVLNSAGARKTAQSIARDIAAWDQLGCLSPHVIYVQTGGVVAPDLLANMLGSELDLLETTQPRGTLPVEVAATISSRRSFYEVRAAHSEETRVWQSKDSTAWTVVFEADPQFQLSCLHRFVYVKAVKDLAEALQAAEKVRHQVSTIGLAAPDAAAQSLAAELARWGAARICPVGHMQDPPFAWRHDGRPSLGELVTWVDWEFSGATR